MRDPSGCRHCGIPEREHLRRWTVEAGWHTWTAPTWQQRREAIVHNAQKPPTP